MTKYTATAITDGTRLRPDHNVNQTYIGSYPTGTKFNGDVLFIATAPTVVNQAVGDTWLQVTDINGVPKTGWVAIIHLGKPVCTLVENVITPPPVVTLPDMQVVLGDDVTYAKQTVILKALK